ncbi:Protein dopey-1 [Exaiptasia diaphana]|nr:Protein dopey-1 [Exaiptasia diaphana]
MEQRAHLLKKLAFVIFCSESDQYQYCLPEIQERLAECIRLPQAPVLHEQVFLALRVLLLRMSPQHLTSLWPVIISETVHVMLQLESDLSTDDKSHDQRMLISETLLGTNGYVSYSQEKWLGLYLAAFKLLDLTLSLPGDRLPHFQMYRWAFEGGEVNCSSAMTTKSASGDGKTEKVTIFKPHIARIWKLLRKRCRKPEDITDLQRTSGRPLLTMYQIKSLDQLLPFLKCLSKPNRSELVAEDSKTKGGSQGVVLFERIVERDFLESLIAD